MTEKPVAFLSLVKFLESEVGHKRQYDLLEPFPLVAKGGKPSIIAIQNAGKIIANHAGLGHLTFIISVTKQEPSKAAHIELQHNSPEVFVELSEDICRYAPAVLAVLCHEISHKFLHVHGLRYGSMPIEQEFLTDVAAIYLGMGKIMLNGCQCQSTYTQKKYRETVTTTHTLQTGYISRECFAFVYRLICHMRSIPQATAFRGLSDPARKALSACEHEFSNWFRPECTTPEGWNNLAEGLRSTLQERQVWMAKRDWTLRKIEAEIASLSATVRESHKPLDLAEKRIAGFCQSNGTSHIRYLQSLELRELTLEAIETNRKMSSSVLNNWQIVKNIEKYIPFASDSSISQVICCPIDRTPLRVPNGKNRLLVTCATCGYKFIVSTAVVEKEHVAWWRRWIKK